MSTSVPEPGLVSVVIPTYQRAYCVGAAIDSALGQSYPRLELLVVDDGSTDGTDRLVQGRAASDPRVRYLRQANGGVAAARNLGLRAARGEFIAFLDSDDLWKPWKIQLQLACLARLPQAGMIWTDMEAIGTDGRVFEARFLRTMYRAAYRHFPTWEALFPDALELDDRSARLLPGGAGGRLHHGDIFSPMIMGNLVHTSTVLLRRERLDQVLAFDEALRHSGEDYDFHLRTCRGGPVAFVDVASVEYQVGRSDQLTRSELGIHMARNFLSTIAPVIERDRDRIRLPAAMLAEVQGGAHAWIGRESLRHGDHLAARRHLWRGLRFQPAQPRAWALLALSCAPRALYQLALSGYRLARRALPRRAAGPGPG